MQQLCPSSQGAERIQRRSATLPCRHPWPSRSPVPSCVRAVSNPIRTEQLPGRHSPGHHISQ
eukprot:13197069-Alexandrium_andersonii.AAC.1